MGTSFTTAHIYNAQNLTKAQFKKAFTDMMKEKGYTASDEENAALTYTLTFAPDRKWVTVLTDGDNTRREAAELAKGLKAHAVMIDLVDSDFAELSLFDETGAHKDTLTLGDSYLEDAAPMGDPAAWQPLLCGSWEQVQEIQNGSYTFAEDALAKFAPLIGMDREDILLDNDSADDDNAVVLHFKKAAEKKLTLNAAFKKYFGDLLEPIGFSYKIINKHPYFIRLINNEILQFLSYSQFSTRKVGYKTFNITYYIMPLYRRYLPDLESNPRFYDLNSIDDLLVDPVSQFGLEFSKKALSVLTEKFWSENLRDWSKFSDEQLMNLVEEWIGRLPLLYSPEYTAGMELAFEYTEKLLLPIFENTVTIEQCIEYLYTYKYDQIMSIELDDFNENTNIFNVSLMLALADYRKDISVYIDNEANRRLERYNRGSVYLDGANSIEEHLERFREQQKEMIAIRDKILDTPEWKERAIKMAEEFKARNNEILRTYGIV